MASVGKSSVALVTGATGVTGRVLVRQLCERGVHVRAIARADSQLGDLAKLPIEWIRGEVYDELIVDQSVSGCDFIFHQYLSLTIAMHDVIILLDFIALHQQLAVGLLF